MAEESLYTVQTPGIPNVGEGGPRTVANAFRSIVDGKVKGFRIYAPVTTTGTFTGVLWQITGSGAGTELKSAAFGALSTGWNEVRLASGQEVSITAGVPYKVGQRTSEGRYAATSGFWATQLTSGNLIGIQDGAVVGGITIANGSFAGDATSYPSSTFGSNGYFIDVIFEATAGESHPTTGTAAFGISATAAVSTKRTTAGTAAFGISATATHSGGDNGIPQEGASYEIEEIMTALAGVFDGTETGDVIGGTRITLECHPEVTGQVEAPAIVLELDDLNWDLNLGAGADGWTVVALALVQYADAENAQRALWRFLSRRRSSGVVRLKTALEEDQTLGGLVSYAIMSNVRNIGIITYNGVDYLGAELIIEVIS